MVEHFTTLGTLDLKKSYHHLRPSPMRPNVGPAQMMEPPWRKPLVVNTAVVGPFDEEEEEISITNDTVKMKGEDSDPDTPGNLPGFLGNRVRRDVRDLRSWVRPPWLALDETPGL